MLDKLIERLRARARPAALAPSGTHDVKECIARGNAELAQGRLSDAARWFRQAAIQDPSHAAARLNLGYVLLEQGESSQALVTLAEARGLDPDVADTHFLEGQALARLGRAAEAADAYRNAVTLNRQFQHAWHALVQVQADRGAFEEALRDVDDALAALGDDVVLLELRGRILSEAGRDDQALGVAESLARAHPQSASAWNNLGIVLYRLGRFEDALAACGRACGLPGASAEHWYNLGCCRLAFNDLPAVLEAVQKGLAIQPGDADLLWLQACAELATADMPRGWASYEARWTRRHAVVPARPQLGSREWDGAEPLAGRTVLVYAEQAFGDTLQFLRFVRPLHERGARIVLRLQPEIVPLARSLEASGRCEIVPIGAAVPPHDLNCSLMSLPLRLGVTLADVSGPAYLQVDPSLKDAWLGRLGEHRGPRIALAWSGKPLPDPRRSIPLGLLLEYLPSGVQWLSLQREVKPEDEPLLRSRPEIFHAGDRLQTFADTAALADCADLVVTIDTGVAHLVGAMGKPTWVLLPYVADWRWMLDREDSPWYPTARLLRQGGDRRWEPVLARMAAELQDHMARAHSAAGR